MNSASTENHIKALQQQGFALQVTDSVTTLLAYWDKNLVCRYANSAYVSWFGKTKEEMIDKITLKQLLGPDFEKSAPFVEGVLNGEIQRFEYPIKSKSGIIIEGLANYFPDLDNLEVKGFVVQVTDVTELKEAQRKEKQLAILAEKGKEMEAISSVFSHDLREPLLTIRNYIKQIHEEYGHHLDETSTRYVNVIFNAVDRMDLLTQGLLNYSILSQATQKNMLDCSQLVNEVLEQLETAIFETKTKVIVEDLPIIDGYEQNLKTLFSHLISNAIKYRKSDTPLEIKISAIPFESGWKFEVKDNGIGINPENKEKIFKMFQRLHNRSEYDGIGVGLGYCKKIVELHDGVIWVESVLGESSNFCFTIPTT